jgi:hypothetical protein
VSALAAARDASTSRTATASSRTARRLAAGLYLTTAVLGLVAAPLYVTLAAAAVAAAFGSALCVSIYRSFTEAWPGIATVKTWTAVSLLAPPYVYGARTLGDLGLFVTLAILALALLRLRAAFDEDAQARTAPEANSLVADGLVDGTSLVALLAGLPLEELFDEWHETADAHAGDDAPEVRRLREELVNEFWRRDPAGTMRWLEAGATEPPERYVHPDLGGIR